MARLPKALGPSVPRDEDVARVAPIPPRAVRHRGSRDEYRDREEEIVQRENAQRAPRIESQKVSFTRLRLIASRIEQNAGDEKAGQHEEHIDAEPPGVQRRVDHAAQTTGG